MHSRPPLAKSDVRYKVPPEGRVPENRPSDCFNVPTYAHGSIHAGREGIPCGRAAVTDVDFDVGVQKVGDPCLALERRPTSVSRVYTELQIVKDRAGLARVSLS